MSQNVEKILKMPLTKDEWDELALEIQRRAKRKERLRKFLADIKGSGAGVWGMDAQEYINQQRADGERF